MALLHVAFHSVTLRMEMRMDVVLPEDARGQIGMDSRRRAVCPTLYLLHGMSDDHTIWQRRTAIERYAAGCGLAVVMPSTHLGWYTDMYMGGKYFTYITQELPALCRDLFPMLSPRREDTFVAGLSMGGYGALKCALRAPEVFSRAASLSGAPDITGICAENEGEPYWTDIFGPSDGVEGSINDLYAAARELPPSRRPPIYMWCGTEDGLLEDNRRFGAHLKALNYDLTYEESPGGHDWRCWDAQIQRVLNWLPLNAARSDADERKEP